MKPWALALVIMYALDLSHGGHAAISSSLPFFEMKDSEGFPLAVSARDTVNDPAVRKANMFPRGAAVLTQSGELATQGIKNIIHAAPGTLRIKGPSFDPTLEGIELSVKNTLALAQDMGLHCVAIPFLGSGIFQKIIGVTKEKLAEALIDTAISNQGAVEVVFVPFDKDEIKIFKDILRNKNSYVGLAPGSIIDFKVHKCDTIVNASNMQLKFGTGLSGIISGATKRAKFINNAVTQLLKKYYTH